MNDSLEESTNNWDVRNNSISCTTIRCFAIIASIDSVTTMFIVSVVAIECARPIIACPKFFINKQCKCGKREGSRDPNPTCNSHLHTLICINWYFSNQK